MSATAKISEILGAETAPEEKAKFHLFRENYMANAERFLAVHPNTVWHQGAFYIWNGRCWAPVGIEQLEGRIYRFLDGAFCGAPGKEKPFPVTGKEVGNMVRALKARAHVERQPPCWTDPSSGWMGSASDWLVLDNGMLNLVNRGMIPHNPTLWTMTALPFAYDEAAECPMWEAFLGQVLADEDIFVLQEWFGYCLTADVRFHKILALIGQRRSGKSTIADMLCALLGPSNITAMTADEWGREFALQDTIDKRLIRVSDARDDSGRGFSGAPVERLLTISGGDPITIRVKYRGGVQFEHKSGRRLG